MCKHVLDSFQSYRGPVRPRPYFAEDCSRDERREYVDPDV